MAECVEEITLQALWQCEITEEEEEEEYINDQVVPLNHMVRDSYLKYLKRVLSKNLNMCSDSSNIYTLHDIEKCAGLLELKALRLCMVTSLYQKAMLQMVADIKQHTKESKVFHKFEEIVAENCLCKVSKCKATQTNFLEIKAEDGKLCGEKIHLVNVKTEIPDEESVDQCLPDHSDFSSHSSLAVSSSVNFNETCVPESLNSTPHQPSQLSDVSVNKEPEVNNCGADEDQRGFINDCDGKEKSTSPAQEKISADSGSRDFLNKINCNADSSNRKCYNGNPNAIDNTGVDKCAEDEEEAIKQLKLFLTDDAGKSEFGEVLLYETAAQELIKILESDDEFGEGETSDQKRKKETVQQTPKSGCSDSYWRTEKELQMKNLHESISKMCCNPEAKVRMKNKFFNLFGFDSDEDDVWCSKEKIGQYKQKIAPVVVKHLLCYYKQKRILNRHVFKCVASHITDKLVSVNHYPEEADVEKGITLFFSYHGFIGKPEDIWFGWDRRLT